MTTTSVIPVHPSTSDRRPVRAGRRVALGVTTFLTCAMPLVFTVNITRMLLTGVEDSHRFHQATGQGLLLFAFWLGGLLPLVRAGWRGERPASSAGWRHLSFVATGAVCAIAAPQGGAPALVGVISVTGALLWWALPLRPTLRLSFQVDPVLLPAALVLTAFLAPYAADQVVLQHAATGHHAQNPHFFDMAWLVAIFATQAVLAAVVPALRALAAPVGVACALTGAAGVAFGESVAWSTSALGLGALLAAAAVFTRTGAIR